MAMFVQVTPDLSRGRAKMVVQGHDSRQLIRSQVMKSFRQDQRENYRPGAKSVPAGDVAWRLHRKRARRPAKHSSLALSKDLPGTACFPVHGHKPPQNNEQPTRLAEDCVIHIIQTTHVYRVALVANFVDAYFPVSAKDDASLASILNHWTSPKSLAMETGNDALALLHFGNAIKDDQIVVEGQRRYLSTLQMVRQDVQRSSGSFESLFAAAQNLIGCEIYSIVSTGLEGWEKRMSGINAIIETRGLLQEIPDFSALLFRQFRHMSLLYALVKRSPDGLPSKSYWATGAGGDPNACEPGSLEELTQLALSLPKLLETCDYLCDLSTEARLRENCSTTIQSLQDIEGRLESWLHYFIRGNHRLQGGLEASTQTYGIHTAAPRQQSSSSVVLFTTFYWILMLLIREAKWSLESTNPENSGKDKKLCEESVNRCAKYLKQSMPSSVAAAGGDVGQVLAVRAPIYFASRWYRRSNNAEALAEWRDLEDEYRGKFPYLDWDALLPLSLVALHWIR